MNDFKKSPASEVLLPIAAGGAADEVRRLAILLHRCREALSARFRPILQEAGLTDPQWRVLRILGQSEEIDVAQLAARSYLMGPSLSRILRDMSNRGLIVRRACETDGRRSFNALTPAGKSLIEELAPRFHPVHLEIERAANVENIRALNILLGQVLETIQSEW